MRQQKSRGFKLEAVRIALDIGIAPAARRFGVTDGTLRDWVHRYGNIVIADKGHSRKAGE